MQQNSYREKLYKKSNSETFITDSGATPHMVNLQENTMKIKDAKTRVTLKCITALTGGECGDCHGY